MFWVFSQEFKPYLWKVVLGMLFYFVETKLILAIVLLTVILKNINTTKDSSVLTEIKEESILPFKIFFS